MSPKENLFSRKREASQRAIFFFLSRSSSFFSIHGNMKFIINAKCAGNDEDSSRGMEALLPDEMRRER